MEALGYIFIFYIAYYFYRLAENHKKNKWLFGFLGIVFFVIAYISYLLYLRFFNSKEFNIEVVSTIEIKAFFTSLTFAVIMFQVLNFIWSKKKKLKSNAIEKIGKE